MAEAHIGPLPEGTKRCRVCGEPINLIALKCIHCSSEQARWRLRLGLSRTVLSLLVALVSVLTAALPALKDFLTERNSDLSISFQVADKESLAFLITNRGARPGSISTAVLDIHTPKPWRTLRLEIVRMFSSGVPNPRDLDPRGPAQIIDPGRSLLINYSTMGHVT